MIFNNPYYRLFSYIDGYILYSMEQSLMKSIHLNLINFPILIRNNQSEFKKITNKNLLFNSFPSFVHFPLSKTQSMQFLSNLSFFNILSTLILSYLVVQELRTEAASEEKKQLIINKTTPSINNFIFFFYSLTALFKTFKTTESA